MQPGRQSTVTAQLIRRTVLLSAIAVIAIVLLMIFGAAIIHNAARNDVREEGFNAAREFDRFLIEIESDLRVVADEVAEQADVDQSLRAALNRHDALFELRIIDPNDIVLAQRRRGAVMLESAVEEQPWVPVVQRGDTYVSTVDFEEFGVPFVTMAVPVHNTQGTFVGSLVVRLDLTALWQQVIVLEVGETGYAYIVDQDGQLLVYSDLNLVRDGFNMVDSMGLQPTDVNSESDMRAGNPLAFYEGLQGDQVVGASEALEIAPWYTIVEIPITEVYGRNTFGAVVITLVLLFTVGLVAATVRFIRRRVANPLRNVIEGSLTFAAGDLRHRIDDQDAQGEMLELIGTLNQMSTDLGQMNQILEARVESRTRDLRLASRVSEQIATVLDPDVLLPQIADQTKEVFNLYHAHIYLLNEAEDSLELSAGAGEIGRMMRDRGHRIPASAELSLVARAARNRQPVVVADTTQEPGFLPNPMLPRTRSEAALPLVVGSRVVGVLDVQSDEPGRFDDDLISVLTTLAGQTAISINNAQLFRESERMTRRERALNQVSQAIQSATSMDDVLKIATRELGRALRVPKTSIELHVEHSDEATADPQPVEQP